MEASTGSQGEISGGGDTVSSITFNQPCHLFTLPQELVDIIFDLVYETHDTTHPDTLIGWYLKAFSRMRRRGRRDERESQVKAMVVSKRYLHEAVRAWLQQRWVDGNSVIPAAEYLDRLGPIGIAAWLSNLLLRHHVRNVFIDNHLIAPKVIMEAFPNAKRVYILSRYLNIPQDTVHDDALMRSKAYQAAHSYRGLRELTLVQPPEHCRAEDIANLLENGRRIAMLARPEYTQPRAGIKGHSLEDTEEEESERLMSRSMKIHKSRSTEEEESDSLMLRGIEIHKAQSTEERASGSEEQEVDFLLHQKSPEKVCVSSHQEAEQWPWWVTEIVIPAILTVGFMVCITAIMIGMPEFASR